MNGQVIEGRLARCICAWSKRPLILSLLLMATLAEGTSQTRDWANFHVGGLKPLQSRLRDAKRIYPHLSVTGSGHPAHSQDLFEAELDGCSVAVFRDSPMDDNSFIETVSLTRKEGQANPCPKVQFGGSFGLGSSWREVAKAYDFLETYYSGDSILLSYKDLSKCKPSGKGTMKSVYIRINSKSHRIQSVLLDNSQLSCADYRAGELDEKNNQKN